MSGGKAMIKSSMIDDIVKVRRKAVPELQQRLEELHPQRDGLLNVLELSNYLFKNREDEIYKSVATESDTNKQIVKHLMQQGKIKEAIAAYEKAILEYEALIARYSRDAINIGVLGTAGAGKSKLLQMISGLGNEYIPSDYGPSCTGTLSTIEYETDLPDNQDVYVYIEFKSVETVLEEVRAIYARLFKNPTQLNEIADIRSINTNAEQNNPKESITKFKEIYIDNYDEWSGFVGISDNPDNKPKLTPYLYDYDNNKYTPLTNIKDAGGKKVYYGCSDRGIIKEFVAQSLEDKKYYQFPAVSHVHIMSNEHMAGVSRLRFIDTVGLDDQNEVFAGIVMDTLKKKCDAAILLILTEDRTDRKDAFIHVKEHITGEFAEDESLDEWISVIQNLRYFGDENKAIIYKIKEGVEKDFANACKTLYPKISKKGNYIQLNISEYEELKTFLTKFISGINFAERDKYVKKRAENLALHAQTLHKSYVDGFPANIAIPSKIRNVGERDASNIMREISKQIGKIILLYKSQTSENDPSPLDRKIELLRNRGQGINKDIKDIIENAYEEVGDVIINDVIVNVALMNTFLGLWGYVRDFVRIPDNVSDSEIKKVKVDVANILMKNFAIQIDSEKEKVDNSENITKELDVNNDDFFANFAKLLFEPENTGDTSLALVKGYETINNAFLSINNFNSKVDVAIAQKLFDRCADKYIRPYDGRVLEQASKDEAFNIVDGTITEFCDELEKASSNGKFLPSVSKEIVSELNYFVVQFYPHNEIKWATLINTLHEKGFFLKTEEEIVAGKKQEIMLEVKQCIDNVRI